VSGNPPFQNVVQVSMLTLSWQNLNLPTPTNEFLRFHIVLNLDIREYACGLRLPETQKNFICRFEKISAAEFFGG